MVKDKKMEITQMTYEQAFVELEQIVTLLEAGSSSLEESLVLFERGQMLSSHCTKLLEQAELRVKQIIVEEPTGQGA